MDRRNFTIVRIRMITNLITFCIMGSVMLAVGSKPLTLIPAIQSANPKSAPSFESATIRLNKSGIDESDFQPVVGGRLAVSNVTLKTLITTAYHLRDSQISDGPGWIDSDRYDVNAKAKNGDVSLQEALQMLQTLLTDRFKLVFHRETKDVAAYTLLSGKNPPKLTPALANGESGIKVLPIEGQKSVVQMVGRNMTMQHLVDILGNQLRVPVIDHTGLTGSFDFDVKLDARDSSPGTSPDLGPLIVTAIQEQLGLKLESTKVPGEFLVIESVERPTLN